MSFSLFRIPRQNSRLPLFLQPFTYCEAVRHVISVESCRSNHDRRIMSENPGVYIAMKSIGPPPSHFQAYPLMQLTPIENDEKHSGPLVNYVFSGHM